MVMYKIEFRVVCPVLFIQMRVEGANKRMDLMIYRKLPSAI